MIRSIALFKSFSVTSILLWSFKEQSTNLEANKVLINRFTEGTNSGNWDAFDQLLSGDFQRYCQTTSDVAVNSREEFKKLQESFIAIIPVQRIKVEILIDEGNLVAAYAACSGTKTGSMGEFFATGKSMVSKFMSLSRIEEGRIAELWIAWDNISMLAQLGLSPPQLPEKEG